MKMSDGELPKNNLRCNVDNFEYHILKQHIIQYGILDPIMIRPAIPEDGHDKPFTVIDDCHRFLIAKELGLEEVPSRLI